MKNSFIEAIARRRSYYHLEDKLLVADSRVVELIDELLTTMPSPFNVQSARVVLLLGDHHREVWQLVAEALRSILPEERFKVSKEKIDRSFASGHGTVLFYEDTAALNHLRENYPLYADNVEIWSEQSSGMLQFAMWTALEEFGYGASLQHYNTLIEYSIVERWHINPDWRLIAQMPFGAPVDTPPQREQRSLPQSRRVVFGL
jgi:predicted oxidoreductase (fatty acid repression mutant protein)